MVNTCPDGRSVKLARGSAEEQRLDGHPPAFMRSDGAAPLFCMPASLVVSREDASLGLIADPQASGWPLFQTSSIGTTPTCHA